MGYCSFYFYFSVNIWNSFSQKLESCILSKFILTATCQPPGFIKNAWCIPCLNIKASPNAQFHWGSISAKPRVYLGIPFTHVTVLKLLLKNVEEILFGRIFLGSHTSEMVSKRVCVHWCLCRFKSNMLHIRGFQCWEPLMMVPAGNNA